VLDAAVEQFRAAGYPEIRRAGPLAARVEREGGPDLTLALVPEGGIFGGSYGLEISTARSVLPRTAGLSARGRGTVRWQGARFRSRRGDAAGAALARRLEGDAHLAGALAAVHFERIRIEPDGRPVIRHLGGSLVWILFPPVIKSVPLVPEQAVAVAAALEAFAAVMGRTG
jgi:hypothetical protein